MNIAAALCGGYTAATVYGPTALAWFAGSTLGYAFSFVCSLFFLNKRLVTKSSADPQLLNQNFMREIWLLVPPLVIGVVFFWIHFHSFKIFMTSHFDLAVVGIFLASYGLAASVVGSAESLLAQILQPTLYFKIESEPRAREKIFGDYVIVMGSVLLLTMCLACLFSDVLIRLLLAEQYKTAATYFVICVFIEGLRALAGSVQLAGVIFKRPKKALLPQGVASALVVLCYLPFLFMDIFSEDKGVWVFSGVLLVSSFLLLALNSIAFKENYDISRYQWIRTTLVVAGAGGLAVLLHTFLPADSWWPIILIAPIIGVAVLFIFEISELIDLRAHIFFKRKSL